MRKMLLSVLLAVSVSMTALAQDRSLGAPLPYREATIERVPAVGVLTVDGSHGLAGIYLAEGTNAQGKAYHGGVEIHAVGDVWQLTWDMPEGMAEGVGILRGDALAVVYQTDGGLIGLGVYQVRGTRLDGSWTMPGLTTETYTETLTLSPARDLVELLQNRGL